ncbi:hypothetical protein EV383_4446 [Pseudonocardia sediminis]|uniref:Uncharacterized protein n=1 Tax=Pseudonocardia sediminis TaxID=1397368 RepID=A0A4Q7V2C9_PSEST|nr:hypothetical protein [Pseudonocardia sediminis]RZT87521.1 hypothetical protein EV383_4446 [Pseudonocardia sediminis]
MTAGDETAPPADDFIPCPECRQSVRRWVVDRAEASFGQYLPADPEHPVVATLIENQAMGACRTCGSVPGAAAGPRAGTADAEPVYEFARWLDNLDAPDALETRRSTSLDDVIRRARRALLAATGPRAGGTAPDDETVGWDQRCCRYEGHGQVCDELLAGGGADACGYHLMQDIARLRSEAAALRAAGDALADGMTLWLTQTDPYSPLGRSTLCPLVDFWRSAAGPPTTQDPPGYVETSPGLCSDCGRYRDRTGHLTGWDAVDGSARFWPLPSGHGPPGYTVDASTGWVPRYRPCAAGAPTTGGGDL